jgi:hypothetical protein
MNIVRIYPALLPLTLLLCVSTPFDDRDYARYEIDHFIIYYRETEFSLQEVQRIGHKKERLLDYINRSCGLDYQGTIAAYLYLYSDEYAYANTEEEIYESRRYVMTDPGHEIVHIVTFEELGYSYSGFFKEGIAVSFELDFENYNAIEHYVRYCRHIDSVDAETATFYKTDMTISRQLGADDFDYSYYSYKRAGAFVKYLIFTFGIDKVKEFYTTSVYNPSSSRPGDFEKIFGAPIEAIEGRFTATFFPSQRQVLQQHGH